MPPEGPKDEDAEDLAATVAVPAKGELDDLAATVVHPAQAAPSASAPLPSVVIPPDGTLADGMVFPVGQGVPPSQTRAEQDPRQDMMMLNGVTLDPNKNVPPKNSLQPSLLTPRNVVILVVAALAAAGIGAAIGLAERDSSSGSAQPAPTQTISH